MGVGTGKRYFINLSTQPGKEGLKSSGWDLKDLTGEKRNQECATPCMPLEKLIQGCIDKPLALL